jgi:hypothetical protein
MLGAQASRLPGAKRRPPVRPCQAGLARCLRSQHCSSTVRLVGFRLRSILFWTEAVRHRWRRGLATGLLLAAVASGVVARWAWARAETFSREMARAAVILANAQEQPGPAVLVAGEHLLLARSELDAIRPLAAPVAGLAGHLAAIPGIGGPAAKVALLWTLAEAGTAVGHDLASAAQLGLADRDGRETGPRLLAAVPALRRHLQAAEANFARAQSARADLATPGWPFGRLEPLLSRWDALAPRLEQALPEANRVAALLPDVLGSNRSTTYLILAQTSDDLRATGGFITSVGTIRIEHGKITAPSFEKVYAAEGNQAPGPEQAPAGRRIQPPAPLSRYMGLGHWLLRDANWWADFPTTARQAAAFWQAARGEAVDGVIAFNEQALSTLLEAAGPVRIAGGETVSAGNVKAVTLERVFRGKNPAAWYAAQSEFSQELAAALLAAIEQTPPERWLHLGQHVQSIARRRDLLVTSFDPTVQTALHELGLDGALGGQRDDYLYLVEQNVSYGKLSPFIRQDLEYTVGLAPDGWPTRATLGLEIANTYSPGRGLAGYPTEYYSGARWNPMTRRLDAWQGYYGGYTRLYFPLGSQVLGAAGFDDRATVGTETDRTVIGGYVGLPSGTHQRLELEWAPAGKPSVPGRYRLLIQRQPGAPEHGLTVRVTLPEGYVAGSIAPNPSSVGRGSVTWRARLASDETFELALSSAYRLAYTPDPSESK